MKLVWHLQSIQTEVLWRRKAVGLPLDCETLVELTVHILTVVPFYLDAMQEVS